MPTCADRDVDVVNPQSHPKLGVPQEGSIICQVVEGYFRHDGLSGERPGHTCHVTILRVVPLRYVQGLHASGLVRGQSRLLYV